MIENTVTVMSLVATAIGTIAALIPLIHKLDKKSEGDALKQSKEDLEKELKLLLQYKRAAELPTSNFSFQELESILGKIGMDMKEIRSLSIGK